jgi:hypothetical protein
MLASLQFTVTLGMLAGALTLLTTVVLAVMVLMAVRLGLDKHEEVLASLSNSMNQALISIWPFTLEVLLLVVLGKGLFCDIGIEKNGVCGFKCSLPGRECTFDFGRTVATDSVRVVIDRRLED